MSKWDINKTEHENMVIKTADIRSLIWNEFPANQSEMIGCPYSVLCYVEDFINGLKNNIEELSKLKAQLAQRDEQIEQLKQRLDKVSTQLVGYEATIGLLKDALEEIANEDFRGNRSSGSVKAYQALNSLKPKGNDGI